MQQIERKSAQLELKAAGDNGTFEGYAAVYGNIDHGDDIIEVGAFDEFQLTSKGEMRLALHHNMTRFIGAGVVESDTHGLHIKGRVNLGVSYAKDAYELMRDGVYDAMSVGYYTKAARYEERDGRVIRIITSASLWEVSVLPFGMNPEAKILDVKSDKRLFENTLRDSMGLSQREAKHLTALYFAHREGDDEATAKMEEIKAADAWMDNFLKEVQK